MLEQTISTERAVSHQQRDGFWFTYSSVRMYGIAAFFLFILFKSFIPTELARQYLHGAVLLGAAPCTAMVFVWSHLTKGDPAYTLVQVAVNDLIILVLFTPIVA